MKFETEFNIDDSAWCMKDNSPTNVTISGIEIVYKGNGSQHCISQNVIKYVATDSVGYNEKLCESKLFKTKNALLKSLFGDDAQVCKGEKCTAIKGINHSPECIDEHDKRWDQVICPGTMDALDKLSIIQEQ